MLLPGLEVPLGSHFRMLHFNATLLNAKATAFLAEMPEEERPDAIGLLECHLRGAALNRMRRVIKKIGWRMFSTPAILKDEQMVKAGEAPEPGPLAAPVDETKLKKHQNTGGEAILVDPSRKASRYHQGTEAFGYRSTLIKMKGWTLHLIVTYSDSGWAFEAGPNALKWQAICTLIQSMNAPWLIAYRLQSDAR